MNWSSAIIRKIHNATHPQLGVVLMLHRVVENRSAEPEKRELEVTPRFLEKTIVSYRKQGYRFVSIDQMCDILDGKDKTRPFACLTFDDGYRDNYTVTSFNRTGEDILIIEVRGCRCPFARGTIRLKLCPVMQFVCRIDKHTASLRTSTGSSRNIAVIEFQVTRHCETCLH